MSRTEDTFQFVAVDRLTGLALYSSSPGPTYSQEAENNSSPGDIASKQLILWTAPNAEVQP